MSTQKEIVDEDINLPEKPPENSEIMSEESSSCDNSVTEEASNLIIDKKSDLIPEDTTCLLENSTKLENNVDNTENQVDLEETNENIDKTNSNKSRELKSILALSKEAKLDTNLPAKRNESTRKRDFAKLHSVGLSAKSPSSKEFKSIKFPVTAEAELEEDSPSKSNSSTDSPKPSKRQRTISREIGFSGPVDDTIKKGRKIVSGDINMLKVFFKI